MKRVFILEDVWSIANSFDDISGPTLEICTDNWIVVLDGTEPTFGVSISFENNP